MADDDFTIVSRPKAADAAPDDFTVVSRPKAPDLMPDGTPMVPGGSAAAPRAMSGPPEGPRIFGDRYQEIINNALSTAQEGAGEAVNAPTLGGKAKGAGKAALGALQYAGAPVELAGRVMGDPVEAVVSAIAGKTAGKIAGNTVNFGTQMATPGGAKKVVEELPTIARAGGELATQAGNVARSTVDAVEDVVKTRMANRTRATADAAANAAPTRDAIKKDMNATYKAAEAAGANVSPDQFKSFVENIPKVLESEGVTSGTIPISKDIYKETKAIQDRLEDYAGNTLTIKNLQQLQQEANAHVKKALIASEGDRGASDVRGATILSHQIRDFIQSLPDEGIPVLGKAKELARRNAKLDDVESIIDVATRLKDPDYLQQEFRRIATDSIALKNYSPAEKELIDKIAGNSRLDNMGKLVPAGKATRAYTTVRDVVFDPLSNVRIKQAKELRDLIARGEGYQTEQAATKAAQPSLAARVEQMVRPQSPNSANRGFPYVNGP